MQELCKLLANASFGLTGRTLGPLSFARDAEPQRKLFSIVSYDHVGRSWRPAAGVRSSSVRRSFEACFAITEISSMREACCS